ncbi:MAG: SRPBCC domain-containing protein [Myxococcota bacterium]
MPSVLTSITIDAPAAVVWDTLTDFDAYPEWNRVILKPRGRVAPGEPFDFAIKVGRLEAPIAARFVRADGTELRWEGPRNRLQAPLGTGSHYFRLEPKGERSTTLIHGEVFGGPLFRLPWRFLGPQLERTYNRLNRAMKERCEAEAR